MSYPTTFCVATWPEVLKREDLATLCNRLGIRVAVEVGTDLGAYASEFLSRWHGDVLLCIDPYEAAGEFSYNRDGDLMTAVVALSRFHPRVKFVRERSPQCVVEKRLPSWLIGSIGFVYIDGCHEYEAVKADIEAWWELLAPAGILAGHDYDSFPGVRRALNEFCSDPRRNWPVYVTQDSPRSWYLQKHGKPNSRWTSIGRDAHVIEHPAR